MVNSRHAEIISVLATWTTKVDDDAWRAICVRPDVQAREDVLIIIGPIPGDTVDPRKATAFAVRGDEDDVRVSLEVSAPPDEAPPEEVLNRANAWGGLTGLREFLRQAFVPAGTVATYSVHFHVDSDKYRPLLLPFTLPSSALSVAELIGSEPTVTAISLAFEHGAVQGIEEIQLRGCGTDDSLAVDVSARGAARLSDEERWLPYADELRDVILGNLFAKSGGDHT